MQNLENKKSIFIQLSTPNENLVRYFCIGNYDNNNLFTGQVYGYEGGGEFSDQFIYKNKFLPEYDTSGEPLDWECNEELFNFLSIERFDDLDDSIRKILDFDSALLQWNFQFLKQCNIVHSGLQQTMRGMYMLRNVLLLQNTELLR
jgi:hypothetical protein